MSEQNDSFAEMERVIEADREKSEVWREGITMSLYVSLSQLAVMTAMPAKEIEGNTTLALTVLLTTVGLILAHQVAFRMSSRLVNPNSTLEPIAPRLLRAQLLGGGAVTALAVIPIALFGPGAYRFSIGLLLLFVMVVGYLVARSGPRGRVRSVAYMGAVGLAVLLVLFVKSLVNH